MPAARERCRHNYIIVDGIHPTRRTWEDRRAFNKLKVEVVRHLMIPVSQGGKGLPSIAVKTGFSKRGGLEDSGKSSSSLAFAIDCLESGQNLLFLDMRERLPAGVDRDETDKMGGETKPNGKIWPTLDKLRDVASGSSRDLESGGGKADDEAKGKDAAADADVVRERPAGRGALIDKAKRAHDEACDKLVCVGTADIFDVMAAAYFHSVLRGNGEESISSRDFTFLPLCDAIEMLGRYLSPPQSYEQLASTNNAAKLVRLCYSLPIAIRSVAGLMSGTGKSMQGAIEYLGEAATRRIHGLMGLVGRPRR